MTDTPLAAVVMAGGLGTRMRSELAKHFHPILGRRMVDWVIETGRETGASPLVAVASPAARDEFAGDDLIVAIQEKPLGTGDAVRSARQALAGFAGGSKVAAHVAADYRETDGVNTRVELAQAGAVLRDRINERHMLAGVTIVDPATTWIEPTVELEADSTVHPFTVLRGATRVLTGAEIHAHTVVIDAEIGRHANVGPFCYLRPGTALGDSSKAGTFVEMTHARIGDRTKVPHLSYIGDADVGTDTNIGAGAI